MRPSPKRLSLTVVALAIVIAAFPAIAGASSTQRSVMQDDGRLLHPDPTVRQSALDEMKALGVDIVKVGLFWRRVVPSPNSGDKPAFDAANPLEYTSAWYPYIDVVKEIQARGMVPWLMISAPAPSWAVSQSTGSTQQGIYEPDPDEFALFTTAVARQWPDVKILSIYNEPNFQYWLWPQMGKGLVSLSAIHYRKIYLKAHTALINNGHSDSTILFGGLAPRALPPKPGQRATQPIRFLRDLFCLDEKLKPLKGKAAKMRECTGSFSKIQASGFAYHPYTVAGGPAVKPVSADDAPIGWLRRVYKVLDRAAALKRLSRKRIPLWNGEFAFQSNPPDFFQTPIGKVPAYLNTSEWLSYADRRVQTYTQYQLFDEPLDKSEPVTSTNRYSGFQSGLLFDDGRQKSGVYDAFRLPLMVFTKNGSSVTVWGCLRTKGPGAETVEIQVKQGSSFRTISTVRVTNAAGYFKKVVKLSGAAKKTFRLKAGNIMSRRSLPVAPVKAHKD